MGLEAEPVLANIAEGAAFTFGEWVSGKHVGSELEGMLLKVKCRRDGAEADGRIDQAGGGTRPAYHHTNQN